MPYLSDVAAVSHLIAGAASGGSGGGGLQRRRQHTMPPMEHPDDSFDSAAVVVALSPLAKLTDLPDDKALAAITRLPVQRIYQALDDLKQPANDRVPLEPPLSRLLAQIASWLVAQNKPVPPDDGSRQWDQALAARLKVLQPMATIANGLSTIARMCSSVGARLGRQGWDAGLRFRMLCAGALCTDGAPQVLLAAWHGPRATAQRQQEAARLAKQLLNTMLHAASNIAEEDGRDVALAGRLVEATAAQLAALPADQLPAAAVAALTQAVAAVADVRAGLPAELWELRHWSSAELEKAVAAKLVERPEGSQLPVEPLNAADTLRAKLLLLSEAAAQLESAVGAELPQQPGPDGGMEDEEEQAQQIAVARALKPLRCAHLGCANAAGDSETELPCRLCSACRQVRYCSAKCAKAAWRQHRPACKLMQPH